MCLRVCWRRHGRGVVREPQLSIVVRDEQLWASGDEKGAQYSQSFGELVFAVLAELCERVNVFDASRVGGTESSDERHRCAKHPTSTIASALSDIRIRLHGSLNHVIL